jgi:hypothetical protein
MEPEGSLPHSQVPATCPYPEPEQPSPCPQQYVLRAKQEAEWEPQQAWQLCRQVFLTIFVRDTV